MAKKTAKAEPFAKPRTLHPAKGRPTKGVVRIKRRPAVLVCELENGKIVELREDAIHRIEPPLDTPIEDES